MSNSNQELIVDSVINYETVEEPETLSKIAEFITTLPTSNFIGNGTINSFGITLLTTINANEEKAYTDNIETLVTFMKKELGLENVIVDLDIFPEEEMEETDTIIHWEILNA